MIDKRGMNAYIKKKVKRAAGVMMLALNMAVLPVCAENTSTQILTGQTDFIQARWNNIATASLTIGFDDNNMGYFSISVTPYWDVFTGFDGQLVLYDENGGHLKSWTVSDFELPYGVEHSYQCEEGKTYTVRFQGYAYGNGTMFDEIDLSVSDKCE